MKYLLIITGLLCIAGCQSVPPESVRVEKDCRMKCITDANGTGMIYCYWTQKGKPSEWYDTRTDCEAE